MAGHSASEHAPYEHGETQPKREPRVCSSRGRIPQKEGKERKRPGSMHQDGGERNKPVLKPIPAFPDGAKHHVLRGETYQTQQVLEALGLRL